MVLGLSVISVVSTAAVEAEAVTVRMEATRLAKGAEEGVERMAVCREATGMRQDPADET
jgi:hypothetical protein